MNASYDLLVRGKNLAKEATEVLSNISKTNSTSRDSMWLSVSNELYAPDVSVIRDGVRRGKNSVFYSIDGTRLPKKDFYGYKWDNEKNIGLVSLSIGSMEENGGWFTSIGLECLSKDGTWQPARNLVVTPSLVEGAKPFNKPHFVEYLFSFDPVKTRGIRIIGDAGGAKHWFSKPAFFTSITELAVYEPIAKP